MHAPLVELRGVEVRLGGRAVLSDLHLALEPGQSWAILGANGSGKTTLLRLLRGEVWPHHQGGGQRLFRLDGEAEESPIGVRGRIGLVSPELQQEYVRRDWDLRAEAVVRSGFTDSVWPPEEATPDEAERIAEVLGELGIAHLAPRAILALSSGEARKVLLARALVGRPRLLFLDEPCHGLDAPSRSAFLAQISRVARLGTPIVLATHRHDELVPEITRVAVLHGGRILAQGRREEVLHRPRPADRPAGASAGRRPPPASPARRPRPETLVAIEHATVRVEGRTVLRDLSLTVRSGEAWAVFGPNGAGKSTLLRLVVGDEQAMPGGRVSRLELGERASVFEVKARVGIVSPELQARHRADLVAEEVVGSGFEGSIGIDRPLEPAERASVARAMARLGVAHLSGRRVHGLSYGEMRKLLLARALVHDPDLLVLDEPCDGLDRESRADLLEAVEALCLEGTPVLLVTHHLEDVVPAIAHVLELDGGRVVYRGPRGSWRPRSTP
ncbi:MAG TPA: ATP-binding cassette domain-containing protein [Anaeromyxobacteraceae bacterium]|nr:ATP-binding cassette domain-containing protein [Anaeromyxobacteraceae bacterium]